MTAPASRPTSVSLHQRILERARLASAFPLARPSRWQTNFWSLNPHDATPYMPKRVLKGVDLSLAHLAWRKSTLLFLRAGVCTSCIFGFPWLCACSAQCVCFPCLPLRRFTSSISSAGQNDLRTHIRVLWLLWTWAKLKCIHV